MIKKHLYKDFLQKQIEETEQRKKFAGSKMTEQERRINTKDIEAYANKMPSIHSKIVGLRSSPIGPHQKYIAQQYGFKPTEYKAQAHNHSSALELGGYMALNPRLEELRDVTAGSKKGASELAGNVGGSMEGVGVLQN